MKAEFDLPAPRQFASLLGARLTGVCMLDSVQLGQLYLHYKVLCMWNKRINLTAIRNLDDAVVRHYCESLFLATFLPPEPVTIADIGSGAGFPGIPIAIVRPDCQVTLIESHQRKAAFLKECGRDLPNVGVTAHRAEDVDASFDWAVSRAVAYRQILRLIPCLATTVALLVGRRDCDRLLKVEHIGWREPICMPWGTRRVVLIGRVPRETYPSDACSTWNIQ